MLKKITVFTLFIGFSSVLLAQNWSTVGGNSLRSGTSQITGPEQTATPFWSINDAAYTVLGHGVYSFGNAFVTTRVAAGFASAAIECRSLQTGALLWTSPFISADARLYAIGFTEDAVYACDYITEAVYALDPRTGAIKWVSDYGSYSYGARESAVFDCVGNIILNGSENSLETGMRTTICLDKHDGSLLWGNNHLYAVGPVGGLAATSTTVYRITGAVNQPILLTAIDILDGHTKYYSTPLPGDGDQEFPLLVGNNGYIYFWKDGGKLYAFEDTGTSFVQKWAYTPTVQPVYPWEAALTTGPDGSVYALDNNHIIHLDAETGTVLSSSSDAGYSGGVLGTGADGAVYIRKQNGVVQALSSDLQNALWQLAISSNIFWSPALAKDGIMVFTQVGTGLTAYKNNENHAPVADFKVSARKVAVGEAVNFYDQSSFTPTSWNWNFEGASMLMSIQQDPSNISYNTPGTYGVQLVATNALGADTMVQACYITVEPVSGTDEPQANASIAVWPNPVLETACFTVQPALESVGYTVYDLSGKYITSGQCHSGQNRIDLHGVPAGVYLLQTADRAHQARIIKQ